jgi:aldose 1-epimerase
LIPTGERASVAGTPMDFGAPTPIGERIDDAFEALQLAGGYDHAWVLRPNDRAGVRPAARLFDPKTGREMLVLTDQPALQFYSGNFLNRQIAGKGGVAYGQRSGLALETEGFPDAPNQPDFPSTVLRPGETYQHRMVHRFTTR